LDLFFLKIRILNLKPPKILFYGKKIKYFLGRNFMMKNKNYLKYCFSTD